MDLSENEYGVSGLWFEFFWWGGVTVNKNISRTICMILTKVSVFAYSRLRRSPAVQIITPFTLAMGSQGQGSVGRPMTISLFSKLNENYMLLIARAIS